MRASSEYGEFVEVMGVLSGVAFDGLVARPIITVSLRMYRVGFGGEALEH